MRAVNKYRYEPKRTDDPVETGSELHLVPEDYDIRGEDSAGDDWKPVARERGRKAESLGLAETGARMGFRFLDSAATEA